MSALAVASQACLLPPPVDEASPESNRQPTIEPVSPTIDGEPFTLSCTNNTTFIANLNDPDPNDTLHYRVFLDYYRSAPEDLLAIEPTDVVRVRGQSRTIVFEVGVGDGPFAERPSETHVVELFVVDRRFDDETPVFDETTVAKNAISPGLSASYRWTINPIDCP